MKSKLRICLSVFIGIAVFSASDRPVDAAEPMDLEAAINHALKQNRSLARKAIDAEAGLYDIEEANAEFEFRWRPEASAGYADGEAQRGAGLAASRKFGYGTVVTAEGRIAEAYDETAGERLNRSTYRVELEQPLFRRFGPLVNREPLVRADRNLKSLRRNYELGRADLVVEVVDLYETLNRLDALIDIDAIFLKRIEDLYRVTKAKEIVGRSTPIDTLRVDLLRGQAVSRLEARRERRETARRTFADLLGFDLDAVFDLEPVPPMEIELPIAEEAVRIALENRLDYAETRQAALDAGRKTAIARKDLYPDLRLIARNEWTGEGKSASDAADPTAMNWFVGLTLGTDLNRTAERARLRRSQAEETSGLEAVRIAELTIAREVHSGLLACLRSRNEMEIAERNVTLAEARLKLARRLYELGRGDNFSVTDAEEAYLLSEAALHEARSEAVLSQYRLFRDMGTLIESPPDLKPEASGS